VFDKKIFKQYNIRKIETLIRCGPPSYIKIYYNDGKKHKIKLDILETLHLEDIVYDVIKRNDRNKKINKLIGKKRLINKIRNKLMFNLKNN
jgi:hypothetical protein